MSRLSRRTRLGRAERDLAALKDSLLRTTAQLHATEVQLEAAERREQDRQEKLEACRIVLGNEVRARAEAERNARDAGGRDGRCASVAVCTSMLHRAHAFDILTAEQSAAANGFTPDWAEAIPEGDAP